MSFPETRLTLIQRIADGGSEADWRQFLSDYWNPACEFAVRRGQIGRDAAEDIVSSMFVVLIRNQLLKRWADNRSAKLRTLLCSVIRKVLANNRRSANNSPLLVEQEIALLVEQGVVHPETEPAPTNEDDIFYRAWVQDLLRETVASLESELGATGRDDDFRVLHGRICENMTFPQIADCLSLAVSRCENGFKYARKNFERLLRTRLHQHVSRYCQASDTESEFDREWQTLFLFLERSGGIEEAVRDVYAHTREMSHTSRSREVVISKLRRHVE